VTRPTLLGYLLAAIMIVTAAYCLGRLAVARLRRRPAEPDADTAHFVMGVAMAGMLVPRLDWLPDGAWVVVFAAAFAWFGWRLVGACRGHDAGRRATQHAPHLLASSAMLYMFLAVSPAGARQAGAGSGRAGPAMPGLVMGGQPAIARFPVLAFALALALLGYVVWVMDRLPSLAPVSILRLAAAGEPIPAEINWPAGMTAADAGDAAGRPARAPAGCGSAVRPRPPRQPPLSPQQAPLSPRQPPLSPRQPPLSPRLAACCEIVMGIAMGYMLIAML